MSVAFRRESDDEHKEPVFELPIPPGPNLVTERGLAQIEAKVSELDAAIAAEADEERGKALRRELRYWQTRRATAAVVSAADVDEVAFGTRVMIRMAGLVRTLAIVGMDEAVPAEGLIGFQAPLARALIGAVAGERIAFGGKTDAIEVLGISLYL
ncbi:GreA/GreB family elongation factor [Sphingomonas sp.]|uniref:GreA/GreB family elongation factor n=1 Tax=Sphingomonas sp. TaxID=28214 RepID=UPI0035C825FA